MGGCSVGRGRLESLPQDGTETDIHKDEPEFKKKILRSAYSDNEGWKRCNVLQIR